MRRFWMSCASAGMVISMLGVFGTTAVVNAQSTNRPGHMTARQLLARSLRISVGASSVHEKAKVIEAYTETISGKLYQGSYRETYHGDFSRRQPRRITITGLRAFHASGAQPLEPGLQAFSETFVGTHKAARLGRHGWRCGNAAILTVSSSDGKPPVAMPSQPRYIRGLQSIRMMKATMLRALPVFRVLLTGRLRDPLLKHLRYTEIIWISKRDFTVRRVGLRETGEGVATKLAIRVRASGAVNYSRYGAPVHIKMPRACRG